MGKWLTKRVAIVVAAAAVGLCAVGVLAQPVIAEMKLLFHDTYVRLVYDANPNNAALTNVLEIDGNDAQVNITGQLNTTGGIGATYTQSFTPAEVATVLPVLHTVAGLVPTAVAQQLDIGYFTLGTKFIFGQSTAQTIQPVMGTIGLDISGDQVDAEAYEMFAGYLGASGRPMVIGIDPAFYFCADIAVADVSGAADLHVGWRIANQTQTATLATYTDYATIGLEGTANPNTIQIMTGNDGTDTTTDTTDTMADADQDRFCVFVSAAGAVTYTVDGVAPTTTAAFTFDDGDAVIPFVHFGHGADLAGTVEVAEWTVDFTSAGNNP